MGQEAGEIQGLRVLRKARQDTPVGRLGFAQVTGLMGFEGRLQLGRRLLIKSLHAHSRQLTGGDPIAARRGYRRCPVNARTPGRKRARS